MGLLDPESIREDAEQQRADVRRRTERETAAEEAWRARYREVVSPILRRARAALVEARVPTIEKYGYPGWDLGGTGSLFLTTGANLRQGAGQVEYQPAHDRRTWDLTGERPVLCFTVHDGDSWTVYLDEELHRLIVEAVARHKATAPPTARATGAPGEALVGPPPEEAHLYASPEELKELRKGARRRRWKR